MQGATGSGKSAIGVLDARSIGKRVLFLAHTKELVEQGVENFEKLWSEVSVGRFYKTITKQIHRSCAAVSKVLSEILIFSVPMILIT